MDVTAQRAQTNVRSMGTRLRHLQSLRALLDHPADLPLIAGADKNRLASTFENRAKLRTGSERILPDAPQETWPNT
jgi:hypothetical protein